MYRDAIFPAFSGFPDFLSVQYKFEIHFYSLLNNIFIFYSIPITILSILNAKITFPCGLFHLLVCKNENPEMSFLISGFFICPDWHLCM